MRTLYHRHKTAPYRRVTKLQQKSARANAQLAYRQALSDHPELKKNLLARMWQKQKLKRQYAKAAREAQKTGKRAKDAAVTTEKIAASVVKHRQAPPGLSAAFSSFCFWWYFSFLRCFSSFSNIGTGGPGKYRRLYLSGGGSGHQQTRSLSIPSGKQTLQMEIDRVETDRPRL